MAVYREAKCKLCRREGGKLFLKGDKCYTEKCPFNKRPTPPGKAPSAMRRKVSEYGLQLREKQKTKRIYGVLEGQFRKYYEIAERKKGITGENMLSSSRGDSTTWYSVWASASRVRRRVSSSTTRLMVNGKTVTVPSYIVKVGDVIAVKENRKNNKFFEQVKTMKVANMPKWLEFDPEKLEGKILALPEREDVDSQIAEHMIVELYSK